MSRSEWTQWPVACLFDFDGVIVDSHAVHWRAWAQAAQLVAGASVDRAMLAEFSGQAPALIAREIARVAGDLALADQIESTKLDYLLQSPAPTLLPGAREMFDALATRAIPHGIASNAPGAFVRTCIIQLDLSVSHVFGYDDVSAPKPDPAPYLTLARALGLSPDDFTRAWIFEDSPSGIQSARQTGMRVCALTTTRPVDTLRALSPDYMCATLLDVLQALP